jgi:hypothetical protein
MSRFLILALPALMCSCSHRSEPAQEDPYAALTFGSVDEIRARADSLGCKQVPSATQPLGPSGAGAFTCTIPIADCGCEARVEVSTFESQGKSRLRRASVDLLNCRPAVGYREFLTLVSPYIDSRFHDAFMDFILYPVIARKGAERREYGVMQNRMFGRIHVQVFFGVEADVLDGDTLEQRRSFVVDTLPEPEGAKLVRSNNRPHPCPDL